MTGFDPNEPLMWLFVWVDEDGRVGYGHSSDEDQVEYAKSTGAQVLPVSAWALKSMDFAWRKVPEWFRPERVPA